MKSDVSAASNRLIYQHDALSITVSSKADERSITLLQQTTYGTSGVRYQQTGQAEKIHHLNNPYFFHLYQHQELIGFYCLDQRLLGFPGVSIDGYYGRYLTVRDDMQGRGYGQLLKSTATGYIQRNVPHPYLFYSYIEAKNTRSMAASMKENFQSVAQLKTYMFRRFAPKKDPRFRQTVTSGLVRAKALVERHYTQYGFQNFINLNYQNHYFTLEEKGCVLAGVQANPILWRFVQIPGTLGQLVKHVVPFVPGLRCFFNPARQAFVVLEGVFVDRNRPDLLPVLLESVLAYFRLHTAMWQIDEKDPLINLLTAPPMGRLSQFQPGVTTHVMVKAVGLPQSVEPGREPAYVSCFDYS